ncbi:MAG TPA: thiamine pyrophosphate-binding protein [Casimicrobiaceae bacterium]|nr:thiamine pyrophosphate-binding protein [Casimicrobiaceae bacterium]
MNGGERVAEALRAHGVPFLFTLCGGHISPILVAAKARGLRVVDTRDEATAVFAADAVARLTGKPGVAALTAGPGLTNAITALKNAQLAQSPVVLLGGAAPTALQGRGALQDIDQRALLAPHVKLVRQVQRVRDLDTAVAEALAVAASGVPGPVFVECAVDLLYDAATVRQWYAEAAGKGTSLGDRLLRWYLGRHAEQMLAGSDEALEHRIRSMHPSPIAAAASSARVARAADLLARAKTPLLLVGSQALLRAERVDEIARAADRLGIPVYLSGMARGLLGRDHPLQMRHARRAALRESDCVLLAGVPCDFRLDYGKQIRRVATLIAANRSAKDARLNRRPTHVALGDAGLTLVALAARLGERARREPWIASLRERDAARQREIDAEAGRTGEHVNPLALLRALDGLAGDDAIMVADGGDFVATASYVLRPRAPLSWLDPGAFGTLGVGAGFALGAALARPASEVWLIWGDGASGYGLAEFDSFVRHRVPVIAVVGNDARWSQIAREQVKLLHDDVATTLARSAYHEVARGFGAAGLEIRNAGDIAAVLREARGIARSGTPVLVNAWLEPTGFREGSISM